MWTADEFRMEINDGRSDMWERILRLSPEGNFKDEATGQKTGANILHLTVPLNKWADRYDVKAGELEEDWEKIRNRLFHVRERRVHPLKDDKILTDWNGLMIAALAFGARVLDKPKYAEAARKAAQFILSKLKDGNGRLFHRFRDGDLAVHAQAADYAFLIYGLISLYQATFDLAFAEDAVNLQESMINEFWDDENGGFFTTGKGNDELPVRPKELYDGAIPSANSVAFYNLLCLSRLTGNPKWEEKAQTLVRAFAGTIKAQPTALTFFLTGLDFALRPGQEIVITGEPEEADVHKLLSTLNFYFTPNKVTLVKSDQNADRLTRFAGFTDGLQVIQGETMTHLCRNGSCTGSSSDMKAVINQILEKR